MNENELTEEDLKLLSQGLDAKMSSMVPSAIAVMIAGKMEELHEVEPGTYQEKVKDMEKERDLMEERVTLLKAKLIRIRQAIAADRLAKGG